MIFETEPCTLLTIFGVLRAGVPLVSAKKKYLQFTTLISVGALIKNVGKDFANLICFWRTDICRGYLLRS